MIGTSPKIPAESQTLKIPIFSNNATRLGTTSHRSAPSLRISNQTFLRSSSTILADSKCKCPHVLVADDDPFQAFYYQTLFLKSMDFDALSIKKEDFRFEIFCCGEDLLEFYKRSKACGCDSLLLVITDYNMGLKKLNGLETIFLLEKTGYKGPLVLRTSDEYDELTKTHKSLTSLLERKTLTHFLNKHDHVQTKEVICNILRAKADCADCMTENRFCIRLTKKRNLTGTTLETKKWNCSFEDFFSFKGKIKRLHLPRRIHSPYISSNIKPPYIFT